LSIERSPEQLEHHRRLWRRILLIIAFSLSVSGYAVLAVYPETSMDKAISRAFLGIGLLVGGFVVALLSRVVP